MISDNMLAQWAKDSNRTSFKINDTYFKIKKLSAFKGFEVAEKIRVAIASEIKGLDAQNPFAILKAILGLPIDAVEEIRAEIFKYIEFSNKNTPQKGAGFALDDSMLEAAFEGMEIVHVYEVFARGLIVNFFYSLESIAKKIGAAGEPPTAPR